MGEGCAEDVACADLEHKRRPIGRHLNRGRVARVDCGTVHSALGDDNLGAGLEHSPRRFHEVLLPRGRPQFIGVEHKR